ncbi:MAG: hypothetical protein ACYC9O_04020 [Candidatus Latescibacterota bacterium]
MAEVNRPQLTEEEKIARKVRIRRTITYILGGIAAVCIIAFVILAWGTKQNISQQTALDTQELRSKLKMIIAIENRYFEENGKYVPFNYLTIAKDLPQYDPDLEGNFKFKFDEKTGTVTGIEKDAASDVNGDNDGADGLTLSVNWEPGVVEGLSGGDFFWTDEDKADFLTRPKPVAPANAPADTTGN